MHGVCHCWAEGKKGGTGKERKEHLIGGTHVAARGRERVDMRASAVT